MREIAEKNAEIRTSPQKSIHFLVSVSNKKKALPAKVVSLSGEK
jgi:hypothetical protein